MTAKSNRESFGRSNSGRRLGARVLFFTAGVSALGLVLAGQAEAQEPRPKVEGAFNVQRFSAPAGPRNFISTRGVRTDGEHAFSFGTFINYGNEPFRITTPDLSGSSETLVVQNLVTADLLGSYTPMPNIQIGLRIPVTFVQGQGVNPFTGAPAGVQSADLNDSDPGADSEKIEALGLSDPELEAKFRFYGEPDSIFVLGAALFGTVPLGEATAEGSYIGSSSVTGGGRLIADGNAGIASFGLNLGYRARSAGRLDKTEIGSEAIFGVAAGVKVGPVVQLMGDVFGASQFSGEAGTNAVEAMGGLNITPLRSPVAIKLAGGAGLTQGAVGVPNFRVGAGFSYVLEVRDQDDDGVDDANDMCPTDPEDLDGFEDGDGCPDTDNDGDGIADDADQCPSEPEDLDDFEDTDGCPEADNDKDGLPDVQDRCPNEPETVNGFEDDDGCPDVPDTDGDGVNDPEDQCPNEPEDTDGFEDTDGCPDLDNDGDGIPDDRDECVDTPEDGKGNPEDGCPEE